MVDRLDLPIRDLLRVVVPGILGAAYIELAFVVFTGRGIVFGDISSSFWLLGFFAGMLGLVVDFHKLPPWKDEWEKQLSAIRETLASVTGDDRVRQEAHAKKIYKAWLDAMCAADLRSLLHYTTGLFYMFSTASTYTAVGSLILFAGAIYQVFGPGSTVPLSSVCLTIGGLALSMLLVGLFHRSARRSLRDAIEQGTLAMRLPGSIVQLKTLVMAEFGT